MRNVLLFLATLAAFSAVAVCAEAQTVDVEAAMKQIPVEGRTTKDFVPKGWELHEDATGDLNGDKLADSVLTITLPYEEAEKLAEGDNYEGAPDIVIVLFGKPGGGYTRFAVNGKLYPDDGDPRSYMTPSIKNGILILNNNWRDIHATDVTYRFRYDADTKKLMLIGFDVEDYQRSSIYEGSKTSENYLTGVRIESAKSVKRKSSAYTETKRTQIARAKIAFEDAILESTDGGWRAF